MAAWNIPTSACFLDRTWFGCDMVIWLNQRLHRCIGDTTIPEHTRSLNSRCTARGAGVAAPSLQVARTLAGLNWSAMTGAGLRYAVRHLQSSYCTGHVSA